MSGVDWDDGNREKCCKHGLTVADVEAVLSKSLALTDDLAHSAREPRFIAIGRTTTGRFAFVAFTERARDGQILRRPISARFMHQKEVRRYEQAIADADD